MKPPSLPQKHSKIQEEFTDDGLLSLAQSGNKKAIKALYADLAVRLKSGGIHDDDVVRMLANICERIGNGDSPNEAFGWKQPRSGRPKENNELRDFLIKNSVLDRLKKKESLRNACLAVSSEAADGGEFPLGNKSIEDICEGLTENSSIPLPDDIFPFRRF